MFWRRNHYKSSWEQFCNETGAEYIDGDFFTEDQISAPFGKWKIIFGIQKIQYMRNSVHRYSRVTALFVSKDNLQFKIYPKTIFNSLLQIVGVQSIKIGKSEFDRQFFLKGNDKHKIQALFANQRICELLQAQTAPIFHLRIKRYKKGVGLLSFEQNTLIVGVQHLKLVYELFGEILNQLCEIGVAIETNPEVLFERR